MRAAPQRSQRGLATLALSLMMLLAMTMVALFASRSMVFEQRSAGNQMRATQAFELAEAGLSWGLARLNDPRYLAPAPSCEPQPGSRQALQHRTLPWTAACSQGSGTEPARCKCGGGAETLDDRDQPGFILEASAISERPEAVALVSRGCTRLSACDAQAAGFTMQASMTTRVLVAPVPLLRLEAGAAVVSAMNVTLGPDVTVLNPEAASHGITVMAGQTVSLAETSVLGGLPGTPPSMTTREAEPALATWAKDDAATFFKAFFGVEPADFRRDPGTRVITAADCQEASACGALLAREAAAGFQQFWIEPSVELERSTLGASGKVGSAERPLVLVIQGDVTLGNGVTANGLWFSVGKRLQLRGAGAELHGAVLARGPLELAGPALRIHYAPVAPRGHYLKLPGSWRDFANHD